MQTIFMWAFAALIVVDLVLIGTYLESGDERLRSECFSTIGLAFILLSIWVRP